jgi:endonuclease YncB( thermonuclease family)
MDYVIEVYDTWGRRLHSFDDVPLLEAIRSAPDGADRIRGLLPEGLINLGIGYRVRVLLNGQRFCETAIVGVSPEWSDTRKLILDRYVSFHEVIEFSAEAPVRAGNAIARGGYINQAISEMVKGTINRASGSIHYTVAHNAYPEGAAREYAKFLVRQLPEDELEAGGISSGNWVSTPRIDVSGAFARDGDTIAGLEVDGAPWPDVRLLMIEAEETSRNAHAQTLHPETAFWTDGEYDASGYKLHADRATAALQSLIDTNGIDVIELNAHRGPDGSFDARVDAFGRYVGLVYGSGECFNAAMVEQGNAAVSLPADGEALVPAWALKEFYSYDGAHSDSIEPTAAMLTTLDLDAGAIEAIAMLAYAAGGYVFEVSPDLKVSFRKPAMPDRVFYFNPLEIGVRLGSTDLGLTNSLTFRGNPLAGTVDKTYARQSSIDAFGLREEVFEHFGFSTEPDADLLANGLLDDVAYPRPDGAIVFYRGNADVCVGDVIEVRGAPLRRLEREISGEWADVYAGKLAGRAREVRHRFSGREVQTEVRFTSPLRTVSSPLSFVTRSQVGERAVFQFRLDDDAVGLDLGYHLD